MPLRRLPFFPLELLVAQRPELVDCQCGDGRGKSGNGTPDDDNDCNADSHQCEF